MLSAHEHAQRTNLANDGAEHFHSVLAAHELNWLAQICEHAGQKAPGCRISGDDKLRELLNPRGTFSRLAVATLGIAARPVRCVLFDKSTDRNWALGWHQDRTIAVREKFDVLGFGPWTRKSGIVHVEPPFHYIAGMITLRAFLDPCEPDNGPLLVAPGSHALGKVAEGDIPGVVGECGQVACLASPGDVWICATSILHASEASRRAMRRRLLMVDYSAAELPEPLQWAGI
jgi:phytanoyl-CoA dioxygenase PhyH